MSTTDRTDPRRAVALRSVLFTADERAAEAKKFLYGDGDADVARRAAEVRASIDPNARPRGRRTVTVEVDAATASLYEADAQAMRKRPEEVMGLALSAHVSQRRGRA